VFFAHLQNPSKNHPFSRVEKYFFCNAPTTPKICHDLRRAQRLGLPRNHSGLFPSPATNAHHPHLPDFIASSPRPSGSTQAHFPHFFAFIPLTFIPLTIPLKKPKPQNHGFFCKIRRLNFPTAKKQPLRLSIPQHQRCAIPQPMPNGLGAVALTVSGL